MTTTQRTGLLAAGLVFGSFATCCFVVVVFLVVSVALPHVDAAIQASKVSKPAQPVQPPAVRHTKPDYEPPVYSENVGDTWSRIAAASANVGR